MKRARHTNFGIQDLCTNLPCLLPWLQGQHSCRVGFYLACFGALATLQSPSMCPMCQEPIVLQQMGMKRNCHCYKSASAVLKIDYEISWISYDFSIKIIQRRKCHFCASSLRLKRRGKCFHCPVERVFVLFRRPSHSCFDPTNACRSHQMF